MRNDLDELAWDDLKVLLAVHRHQSLLAAGKSLGLSTSTTARRIEQLERAVGRTLVLRTTQGTALDPGAMELVELAEAMELGLLAARRQERELGGTVRISTGDGFAGPLLPVLAELRRRTPETFIELVSELRVADLARREADLGLRTARSRSAVLVERHLGGLKFALYASRDFVERRLRHATLTQAELGRLECVGHLGLPAILPQVQWFKAMGARRFAFCANTDALVLDAIRQSQGIGLLAELVGNADPTLQRLPFAQSAPDLPVWLAFHRELRAVPRVRSVANAIEAALRARLQS